MKMKELLSNEKRWTQGAYARDEMGTVVTPESASAVSFCLLGAVRRCYGGSSGGMTKAWARLKAELGGHDHGFTVIWNDLPGRTFGEVKALLKKLNM
jgi:hypothetical protein